MKAGGRRCAPPCSSMVTTPASVGAAGVGCGSAHAALGGECGEQCSEDGDQELHNLSNGFAFHNG